MKQWIALSELSEVYEVEVTFFDALEEHDLIQITTVENVSCIECSNIEKLERIIRLSNELEVNIQGIDVILNLVQKIETLNEELTAAKNRLRLYE